MLILEDEDDIFHSPQKTMDQHRDEAHDDEEENKKLQLIKATLHERDPSFKVHSSFLLSLNHHLYIYLVLINYSIFCDSLFAYFQGFLKWYHIYVSDISFSELLVGLICCSCLLCDILYLLNEQENC